MGSESKAPSKFQLSAFNSQLSSASPDYVYALKDVSFEVKQGEVLGIIGRNGAGKSTLLKILSRVTTPTSGEINVKGRIASLLEVGTGFHPELSGRDNIYLNGAILGMRKHEIDRKFDEIVDFSGCERYIDTPVKRYSSGMYVRLAFAVAAHLEPEILIVDEVLAVGDAEFQKKCLGKMKDVAEHGRTVLFVSHNMGAVLQLTKTGIVLANGRLVFAGNSDAAVDFYSSKCRQEGLTYEVEHKKRTWTGSQAVKFLSFSFPGTSSIFAHGEPIVFSAVLKAQTDVKPCRLSLTVFKSDGTPVGSCFGRECLPMRAGETITTEVSLHHFPLAPGHYHLGLAVGRGNHLEGHVDYDVVLDVLNFEVQAPTGSGNTSASWSQGWGSIIFPPPEVIILTNHPSKSQ
jgi:lipopolysaccharide transport system ATP-binding protein